MMKCFWLISILFSFSSGLFGQIKKDSLIINEVIAAQTGFSSILKNKDWKNLPNLLADSMHYIHSFGRVDTKADFIKNIARFTAIPRWENTAVKVTVYKNTAVVVSNLYVTLNMPDGTEQISQQRSSEVWLKVKKTGFYLTINQLHLSE